METCTVSIESELHRLNGLRLPELQAEYASVVGEPSRSPNKVFLLRRIEEALRARALPPATDATGEHGEGSDTADAEVVIENAVDVASEHDETAEGSTQPEALVVEEPAAPELIAEDSVVPPDDARFVADEDTGEVASTRSEATQPVTEHLPDAALEAAPTSETATSEEPVAAVSRRRRARSGLAQMTVEELQALYVREVGRPTTSSDKPYLIWKIRQARNGKIRVGEAQRQTVPSEEKQVVPLPLPRDVVQALDEIVERTDHRSRTSLLRRALATYLRLSGHEQVASRLEDA